MTSYEVKETYINRTDNVRFGDSGGWIPALATSRAELFLDCQKEYGRCIGKVYVDEKVFSGCAAFGVIVPPKYVTREVGWVFEKNMVYEDMQYRKPRRKEDIYRREVWVEYREDERKALAPARRPYVLDSLEG